MSTRKYLLTSKEVAKLLGVTDGCLQKWRCLKTGVKIPYIVLGNRMVRYAEEDVFTALASLRRGS